MDDDTPELVADLSDAIAKLIAKLGNEAAGKLIHRLADDLGATRKQKSAGRGVQSPPDPEPA